MWKPYDEKGETTEKMEGEKEGEKVSGGRKGGRKGVRTFSSSRNGRMVKKLGRGFRAVKTGWRADEAGWICGKGGHRGEGPHQLAMLCSLGLGILWGARAPSPGANGTWETISAGFPVVELQDAAQALAALDLASLLAEI